MLTLSSRRSSKSTVHTHTYTHVILITTLQLLVIELLVPFTDGRTEAQRGSTSAQEPSNILRHYAIPVSGREAAHE